MRLDYHIFSNAGDREINEDAAGVRLLPDGGRFVLADGLGGHQNGQIASKAVVKYLLKVEGIPLPERMENANAGVLKLQEQSRSRMKTTAVALTISGDRAEWAHVGDSRLYYFRADRMVSVTEDHSVAYKKYRAGEITRAQIGQDEDQPQLLRALGNPRDAQAEFGSAGSLLPGDAFLLCSDGVWEYLLDEEILVDLLKSETAKAWAEQLLLRVMERVEPGHDNLSLIAIMLL